MGRGAKPGMKDGVTTSTSKRRVPGIVSTCITVTVQFSSYRSLLAHIQSHRPQHNHLPTQFVEFVELASPQLCIDTE